MTVQLDLGSVNLSILENGVPVFMHQDVLDDQSGYDENWNQALIEDILREIMRLIHPFHFTLFNFRKTAKGGNK